MLDVHLILWHCKLEHATVALYCLSSSLSRLLHHTSCLQLPPFSRLSQYIFCGTYQKEENVGRRQFNRAPTKHQNVFFTTLSNIFKWSMRFSGQLGYWKIGQIIGFQKSRERHSPWNYTAISLTSTPFGILQHIVASHLAEHLNSYPFFYASSIQL